MTTEYLNTEQAAERLGLSQRRVAALCKQGRLGRWIGRGWQMTEAELARFAKIPRRVGRPPKRKPKAKVTR